MSLLIANNYQDKEGPFSIKRLLISFLLRFPLTLCIPFYACPSSRPERQEQEEERHPQAGMFRELYYYARSGGSH